MMHPACWSSTLERRLHGNWASPPCKQRTLACWMQQAQQAAHRCQQQEYRAARLLGLLAAAQRCLEEERAVPRGSPPLTLACCHPHPGQGPSSQGCHRLLRPGQAAAPIHGRGRLAVPGPSAGAAVHAPSGSPWGSALDAALLPLQLPGWARPQSRQHQQLRPLGVVHPCRAALAAGWLAGLSWGQRAPAPAPGHQDVCL